MRMKSVTNRSELKQGMQVVSIPNHIQEMFPLEDGVNPAVLALLKVKGHDLSIQRGFITSVTDTFAFVRYWNHPTVSNELRTRANSEATYFRNLFIIDDTEFALPVEQVRQAWKRYCNTPANLQAISISRDEDLDPVMDEDDF